MSLPFTRAPHRGDAHASVAHSAAPNAALLIDFDNVTMGMRSDLSRDLRKLLESDIIKGKVTVQRAYADWRRYPQYIVPLSENSIDLIFAPAYGSSKKNATDIRMAIDAVELVFTRPEIGTFILLTGDSDFSSCVLKLKEYGKYVIGVGIQESSSDILVQNCDEYYSYTSLTGLTKTTGGDQKSADPWVLVGQAINRMADRNDVMRSDRLKQVMIELDPSFDEGSFGFSKFSRFLTEAASKNLVELRKMENGQYEVSPPGKGGGSGSGGGARGRRDDRSEKRDRPRRDRSSGRGRDDSRSRGGDRSPTTASRDEEPSPSSDDGTDPLTAAYGVLTTALEALKSDGRHPVRDSDVKRRMLEVQKGFDEGELGFPKFSRFLQQASDDGVIGLQKQEGGNYEVSLADASAAPAPSRHVPDEADEADESVVDAATTEPETMDSEAPTDESPGAAPPKGPVVRELRPEDVVDPDAPGRRLGPRGGTTRRRGDDDAPPPLLPGQAGGTTEPEAAYAAPEDENDDAGASGAEVDVRELGLPTDADAQLRYLTNSYRGVGKKTAEALVEAFGEDLFSVLHTQPERVRSVVPAARAEALLEAWREDLARRAGGAPE
ncbi:MAG: NYN domain-containing protein, partial [Gemmatimonadetes bacterium]|nr:NYN domain-containing protein [Gemmatimonadota bacterium]